MFVHKLLAAGVKFVAIASSHLNFSLTAMHVLNCR